MIKFFRSIRQKLIKEGKTINYFKYAIGEIVLVVLGILIALQINNWNEDRKDQLTLKNHYTELLDELNNDRNSLKGIIEVVRNLNDETFEISEFINASESNTDTTKLANDLLACETYAFFSVSKSAYTTLLSSGDIQLIKNTQLKKALSIYHDQTNWGWNAHNGNLKLVIERYSFYVHRFLPPLMFRDDYRSIFENSLKSETFRSYTSIKRPKIEWNRIKNDEEFANIISQLITYRVFQLNFYNKQLESVDTMIDLIQNELK